MEPCIAGPRENTPRTSTSCSADVGGPRDAWSARRVWPGKTTPTRHKDSSSRFITKTGPPSPQRLTQNWHRCLPMLLCEMVNCSATRQQTQDSHSFEPNSLLRLSTQARTQLVTSDTDGLSPIVKGKAGDP